jgi:hypothetical protein
MPVIELAREDKIFNSQLSRGKYIIIRGWFRKINMAVEIYFSTQLKCILAGGVFTCFISLGGGWGWGANFIRKVRYSKVGGYGQF